MDQVNAGHGDGATLRATGRIEAGFVSVNRWLIVVMMAAMVALVFCNVISRYVLRVSIVWAEELSQYLMVWIVFLGAGLAFREGRHVAVEFFQDRMGSRLRRGVRSAIVVGIAAFLAGLVVLGIRYALFAADQETPVMNISLAIPYLCIPIGAALFLAHLLLVCRAFIDGRVETPESLESGADEEA